MVGNLLDALRKSVEASSSRLCAELHRLFRNISNMNVLPVILETILTVLMSTSVRQVFHLVISGPNATIDLDHCEPGFEMDQNGNCIDMDECSHSLRE